MNEVLLNTCGVRVELVEGRVGLRIGDEGVDLSPEAFTALVELLRASAVTAGENERLRAIRMLTGLDGPPAHA